MGKLIVRKDSGVAEGELLAKAMSGDVDSMTSLHRSAADRHRNQARYLYDAGDHEIAKPHDVACALHILARYGLKNVGSKEAFKASADAWEASATRQEGLEKQMKAAEAAAPKSEPWSESKWQKEQAAQAKRLSGGK